MNVSEYEKAQPKLELFEYFNGQTKAWGQFQDRSGKVIRRFTVNIEGVIDHSEQTLTLTEDFVYDDGEQQQRIWVIEKLAPNQFRGKAGDVVGEAEGISAGNALNWRYTLDLPYKNSSIYVQFNDWMFLHGDGVMINRAEVTKWGFRVGEVTLFFSKEMSS